VTTAAWTGGCRAPWAPWVIVGLVLLFSGGVIVMAQDPQVPAWSTALFGVVGLAAVVSILFLSRVSVTVDQVEIVVRYGPWLWPVQRIATSELSGMEATDISPMRFGGWGYRWVPNRRLSGAILRKGPGLVLHRTDGRTFAVTVDNPEEALSRVPDRLVHP
jgi:uncharacterized membrane protein YuzA (DUF378 family)